jgi:transcriptional antiterminator RfaH
VVRGRRVDVSPPLFPGYLFIWIEIQWSRARWAPGVASLIMAGDGPARVPDSVISEIRSRERNGLVELVKPPRLRRGDRVRIVQGVFRGHLALYDGMAPRERVAVLLQLLGGQQRAELPADAIEPIECVS